MPSKSVSQVTSLMSSPSSLKSALPTPRAEVLVGNEGAQTEAENQPRPPRLSARPRWEERGGAGRPLFNPAPRSASLFRAAGRRGAGSARGRGEYRQRRARGWAGPRVEASPCPLCHPRSPQGGPQA